MSSLSNWQFGVSNGSGFYSSPASVRTAFAFIFEIHFGVAAGCGQGHVPCHAWIVLMSTPGPVKGHDSRNASPRPAKTPKKY